MGPFICLIIFFFVNSALALQPQIDTDFIRKTLNKTVPFDQQKGQGWALPNCLATSLRAGGYLPIFAGSNIEYFQKHVLPLCFKRTDSPVKGDLGLLFYDKKTGLELAHSVLFLDDENVFEKASPNTTDYFRYNTWLNVQQMEKSKNLIFEIYRFKDSANCPLTAFFTFYSALNERSPIKILGHALDERIQNESWKKLNLKEVRILKKFTKLNSEASAIGNSEAQIYQQQILKEIPAMLRGIKKSNLSTKILNNPAGEIK